MDAMADERLSQMWRRTKAVLRRIVRTFDLDKKFRSAQLYAQQRPLLTFTLLVTMCTLSVPVGAFMMFAAGSLAFTFMGFMFVEGTILTIAGLILGGLLLALCSFVVTFGGAVFVFVYFLNQLLKLVMPASGHVVQPKDHGTKPREAAGAGTRHEGTDVSALTMERKPIQTSPTQVKPETGTSKPEKPVVNESPQNKERPTPTSDNPTDLNADGGGEQIQTITSSTSRTPSKKTPESSRKRSSKAKSSVSSSDVDSPSPADELSESTEYTTSGHFHSSVETVVAAKDHDFGHSDADYDIPSPPRKSDSPSNDSSSSFDVIDHDNL